VTWQNLGALTTARAREFWITWRRSDDRASGLVAFYVIRSGNGAGLFLQPRSPHWATLNNLLTLTLVYTETDNTWLLVRKQKLSYWQNNHDSYTIQASVLSNCRIESNRIEKSIHQRESNLIDFFSTNRNALLLGLGALFVLQWGPGWSRGR